MHHFYIFRVKEGFDKEKQKSENYSNAHRTLVLENIIPIVCLAHIAANKREHVFLFFYRLPTIAELLLADATNDVLEKPANPPSQYGATLISGVSKNTHYH